MQQESKFQLSTAILTILTVAAAVSAGINFLQQLRAATLKTKNVAFIEPAVARLARMRLAQDAAD